MKKVSVQQAAKNLSALIEKACRGEQVVIAAKDGRIIRLVPITKHKGQRKLGILKGKLVVGPEFFEPLSPEELASWQ
jgi:antitoxin (DNA-binding transcriptional repressor) of toxin-antitoxin stability system